MYIIITIFLRSRKGGLNTQNPLWLRHWLSRLLQWLINRYIKFELDLFRLFTTPTFSFFIILPSLDKCFFALKTVYYLITLKERFFFTHNGKDPFFGLKSDLMISDIHVATRSLLCARTKRIENIPWLVV